MIDKIRKVAVLGAGVMGSGIAAHVANAGIPCLLLDIVPPNPGPDDNTESKAFRNRFSDGALVKLKKSKPAALYHNKNLKLIETGNFDDDLARIAECDWVVEVVKEDLAIKQALFEKVDKLRKPGTLITSNTSGLSIEGMVQGRSDDFKKHFLVTHFFNPVRYLKLLELVPAKQTDPAAMTFMANFGENVLGKGIVYAKDTTNFIANRIGVYGMMKTLEAVVEMGYKVEEVDKIFGPAMGRPSSAVFRTADVVGLDTFIHVATNCYDTLTKDENRNIFRIPDFLSKMVDNGWLGSKSGQGFYKKDKDADGNRVILSLDLKSLEYKTQDKVRIDSLGKVRKVNDVRERIKTIVEADDRAGELARVVTDATLAYSARRLGEISDDILNIDRGLRWGFGWELGPFETWDAMGVAKTVERMDKAGIDVPKWVKKMLADGNATFYSVNEAGDDTYYDPESAGYVAIEKKKREVNLNLHKQRGAREIHKNFSASLWDIGDGVACLEFHSGLQPKLNPIDDDIGKMIQMSLDTVEKDFEGMVIYTDNDNFSAGANVLMLLMNAKQKKWDVIEDMIDNFQQLIQRLKYSDKPVVAAPAGLALGGGAEVVLGANAIQAAAELYIGLVEVGVGLIPGGGGNLNLLKNWYGRVSDDPDFDPFPFLKKVFLSIGMGSVATSAEEGRAAGFLMPTDGISLNREHVLATAKERVLGMARAGFVPPRPVDLRLPGKDGAATIDMLLFGMLQNHQISDHDRLIGNKLARVLTGGDTSLNTTVTEQHLLDLEREAFVSLCGEEKTQARMAYMLEKGKPLRN